MSRRAKVTLASVIALTALTVWGVHYQQQQEHETMYAGVLRDDERRKAKAQQRLQQLEDSRRKREVYERVQSVNSKPEEAK